MAKITAPRILMFSGALLLTVVLPLIWGIVEHGWIAVGCLVLAEGLLFLTPANWKSDTFPLRLPLLLFVYPIYFIASLVLMLCAAMISWKILLTIALILTFVLLVAVCVCGLTVNSDKEK